MQLNITYLLVMGKRVEEVSIIWYIALAID